MELVRAAGVVKGVGDVFWTVDAWVVILVIVVMGGAAVVWVTVVGAASVAAGAATFVGWVVVVVGATVVVVGSIVSASLPDPSLPDPSSPDPKKINKIIGLKKWGLVCPSFYRVVVTVGLWLRPQSSLAMLVRAECVCQRKKVAIKLGIIFSSFWAFCSEQTWSLIG